MGTNESLTKARYTENTDEWYTPYELVEEELNHYKADFRDKVIYCNCDDPKKSSFSKYFLTNFNALGISRLICTHYVKNEFFGALFSSNSSYYLDINHVDSKDLDKFVLDNIKPLGGNGDFSSQECIEFLKQADIVVTNPPFSKFRELVSLLERNAKKYLLVGNQNALTYKEIFPLFINNKVWVGYRFGDMYFKVPEETLPRPTRFWVDDKGQKWRSLGNVMWLTNLPQGRSRRELKLDKSYLENNYLKYDDYDAINVDKVKDIPYDYDGIIGVPLTFLRYYDESRFEIVGEAKHGSDNEFDLFKPTVNGKELFTRILIKHKKS